MAHKKVTVNKVVANSRNYVVTPEYLERTLNIGMDKAKQMLSVTTQQIICTTVNPISRIYRTDHLEIFHKYISVLHNSTS